MTREELSQLIEQQIPVIGDTSKEEVDEIIIITEKYASQKQIECLEKLKGQSDRIGTPNIYGGYDPERGIYEFEIDQVITELKESLASPKV